MIEMMNTNGFSGAIYRTEYVTVCQSMTRVDTPIAVCFLLLLFAVEITTEQENMYNEETISICLRNYFISSFVAILSCNSRHIAVPM